MANTGGSSPMKVQKTMFYGVDDVAYINGELMVRRNWLSEVINVCMEGKCLDYYESLSNISASWPINLYLRRTCRLF